MSDKERGTEEELDSKIGKRFLVLEVDDATGDVECDTTGFAGWELVGLSHWLEVLGEDSLKDPDDVD